MFSKYLSLLICSRVARVTLYRDSDIDEANECNDLRGIEIEN